MFRLTLAAAMTVLLAVPAFACPTGGNGGGCGGQAIADCPTGGNGGNGGNGGCGNS